MNRITSRMVLWVCLFAAGSAHAGSVTFSELLTSPGVGEYTLHLQSDPGEVLVVDAFAVGNDFSNSAGSGQVGWAAAVVSASEWDAGFEFTYWPAPSAPTVTFSTADLPDFSSLFGSETQVNFYWREAYYSYTPAALFGDLTHHSSFYFNAVELASNFAPFGYQIELNEDNDQVLSAAVTVIPEPAGLMLLSTAGLAALGRRRAMRTVNR